MKKGNSIILFNKKQVRRIWDGESEVYEKIVRLKMTGLLSKK